MMLVHEGLYTPGAYRLALKVRDNFPFKSEGWNDAQEIVKEIMYQMIRNNSTFMYHRIKDDIESLMEAVEANPSDELDDQIDKLIDFLYCYNQKFYQKLREEVELPERWKDED